MGDPEQLAEDLVAADRARKKLVSACEQTYPQLDEEPVLAAAREYHKAWNARNRAVAKTFNMAMRKRG